ncbi:MAG: signal peptidase I [Planctomycetota bacterium]|nr:signal peptidase I [Planctomycetota bacterium]
MPQAEQNQDLGIIETLQSLVVAFVIAMVFRGFVIEGFVIPTGSMAPTLLGQHLQKHSDQTGQDFAVGLGIRNTISPDQFVDPLLGRNIPLSMAEAKKSTIRRGDRVLVHKTLYPFFQPERYDVVVFKNPTDTQGPSANYIKRLIGLPGETLWIVDGDIFAKQGDGPFTVQRKPDHIQQSLWRKISDSDAIVSDQLAMTVPWRGPPWEERPNGSWTFNNMTWSCSTSEPSVLEWDQDRLPIDDWLPYNMLMPRVSHHPLSDIRVSATITPNTEDLVASFTLDAIEHRFTWSLSDEIATISMLANNGDETRVEALVDVWSVGSPTRVEFWHFDQSLYMYVNSEKVIELLYDFGPEQRLRLATGANLSEPIEEVVKKDSLVPKLSWQFDGSPLTITRLQVDHDLYYRGSPLSTRATKNPTKLGNEDLVKYKSPAFGTHPDKLAVLKKDQFLMAGDNSAYSLDGRLWGNPDEYVAAQIDASPFVVHRSLLIGKAWGVYWLPPPLIPDFGRFRFIR